MTQIMEPMTDYAYLAADPTELLQDKFNLDNYFHAPLPYHIQAECDWLNSPSPSIVSTPSNSPTTPSPHLSSAILASNSNINNNNAFPSHWPTGPTSSDPSQSIKDVQRLTDAKSRRRQQNRESQRAFRERKNRHIEQLEQSLADLQHRHEKLLQCFVGLTAKVSGAGNMGDLSFLEDEQPQRVMFGGYSSGSSGSVGSRGKRSSGKESGDMGM